MCSDSYFLGLPAVVLLLIVQLFTDCFALGELKMD